MVKRYKRGQSMVEMALILPFFILLILAIADGGYYVYTYSELENAARRGSEWAFKSPPWTTDQSDDNTTDQCAILIKLAVIEHIFQHDVSPTNISISYPDEARRDVGVPIEVSLTYTGPWLTPLARTFFGPNMTFSFVSRRTIVSTSPPVGRNPDCS